MKTTPPATEANDQTNQLQALREAVLDQYAFHKHIIQDFPDFSANPRSDEERLAEVAAKRDRLLALLDQQLAQAAQVVRHDAGFSASRPYLECSEQQWERHTQGMTERGKRMLANMLAHHCLLIRRDELGWLLTRYDLITKPEEAGGPFWHVSNDGVLTYAYQPQKP